MMLRLAIWVLAGIASVALTVMIFFPASWMTSMVESQTAGRLTLGDAHGTLWRGSAFIGGAASGSDPLTPLLPGRFSWRLSPLVLLGSVDAELENAEALSQPIIVKGNWHQWQVSPGAILLSAERLTALGAPLNTVQPSGQMRLLWEPLQLKRQNGTIGMFGAMHLEMNDLASRLSPVKPLGSYDLQFSGTAQAEAGQEQRLANFLNLLGQHRREGDKDVIGLEFK
jgi:general secretion pathway protein N